MNIFRKIALCSLKKNRSRTAVTIIGVTLSALMITGIMTFGVSLMDYMARGAVRQYGEWSAAFLDADASFVRERMQDQEVQDAVTFQNVGYAEIEGAQNPERPYFYIAGFQEETFDALRTTLLSGRLPQNSGEILVSAKAETDAGVSVRIGDRITLLTGSRMNGGRELTQATPYLSGEETFTPKEEKSYTIVGICRTPVFEVEGAPGYTLITRDDGTGHGDGVSLFLTLENMREIYSYTEQVKEGYTCILNYDVLRIMGISDRPADRVFMTFLYSFGGIVLAIIVTGSVFLIYNSFSISLSERIREIGVLASAGATAGQLRNSVLFEGMCIGVVGIPAGILAGLGGMKLVLAAVSDNFSATLYQDVPLTLKVSAPVILGAAAVSMVTILISAYLPAKKAVSLPVMECIRQTNEIRIEAGTMEISRRTWRMYGLEGTLALKNFKRNRKRCRSIIFSLCLSIVLFISTNALIIALQHTASGFKTVSDFDIGFGTWEMEDGELFRLFEKLKNVSGVQEGSCREMIRYSCPVSADALTEDMREVAGATSQEGTVDLLAEVHFLDDAFYEKIVGKLGLPIEAYNGQNGKRIAVAKINDDSDDVKGAGDLADLFQTADMDLHLILKMADGTTAEQGKDVSAKIAEFVPPDIPPMPVSSGDGEVLPYTFQILVPWSAKEQLAPSGLPADIRAKGLCFDSQRPSRSVNEMGKIIAEEGTVSSYILFNSAEAFEQHQNYIFIANIFAYTFIVLISLIAAANVFNTISTNIRLRRRELAMLRSVGMSDRDFNKMMRFECIFYGMKSLAAGIPLALLLSVLIVKIMMTDETRFILPWGSVGISVLSVFLVIFVTMMYAISKIKKENIIDALRDEMT